MKKNQKHLSKACFRRDRVRNKKSQHVSESCGHGRIEIRTVSVLNDFCDYDATEIVDQWGDSFKQIIHIERNRAIYDTKEKKWKYSTENSWFVSTIIATPKQYQQHLREYWAIENSNHWVRDNTMGEDCSRIRIKPGIMARLRSFALNTLRANNHKNIKSTRFSYACSPKKLFKLNQLKKTA